VIVAGARRGDGAVELAANRTDHVGVGAQAVGHVVGVLGRVGESVRPSCRHPDLDGIIEVVPVAVLVQNSMARSSPSDVSITRSTARSRV
jgi:hypothetical protein